MLLALLVWSAPARAIEDEPFATPYRPSVASSANLPLPGWIDAEFGGQRLGGHRVDRRDSVPYLFKLAYDDNWGVLLGGDALLRVTPEGGRRLSGVGDTTLTLKHRLPTDSEATAFGFEATVKLPSARDGLGNGRSDVSLKGIYSVDLGADFHLDANLLATRFGRVDVGQGRNQWAWAAALSHPAGEDWSLVADLSGTAQRGAGSTAQLLGAASYSVSKRMVLDAGGAFGLNRNSPKWTVFAGMTVLFGQLF